MKKIIYNRYGGVNELQLIQTAIPEITERQILIKVKAVSINPIDWKIREGEMKMMSGSKFPKGIGIDFSGEVEKTGNLITKFKRGDKIFGSVDQFKGGALAEFLLVEEKDIIIKPANISFEKAAALPVVGFAALQIFDKLVNVQERTEVLINGASGGIGMLAIQIAKKKGAVITAVVNDKGVTLARQLGCEHILDYRQDNVLETGKKYDVVIDLSGKMPFSMAATIMKPVSTYVNTVPGPKQILGSFFHNLCSRKKYRVLLSKPSMKYLETLSDSASHGLDIVIGKTYRMDEFRQAYAEIPKGGLVGKAIFTLGN